MKYLSAYNFNDLGCQYESTKTKNNKGKKKKNTQPKATVE